MTNDEIVKKMANLKCFFKPGHSTNEACNLCTEEVEKAIKYVGIDAHLIEDMAVAMLNNKGIYDNTRPSNTQLEYAFNILRDILPTIREEIESGAIRANSNNEEN